jgi:hypothetical protein
LQAKVKYQFSAKLWKSKGKGGWYFVSLPKSISKEIRAHFQWQEEGWGRMKAKAEISAFDWDSAIWYDSKLETYLLPIKTDLRKEGEFKVDDVLNVNLYI